MILRPLKGLLVVLMVIAGSGCMFRGRAVLDQMPTPAAVPPPSVQSGAVPVASPAATYKIAPGAGTYNIAPRGQAQARAATASQPAASNRNRRRVNAPAPAAGRQLKSGKGGRAAVRQTGARPQESVRQAEATEASESIGSAIRKALPTRGRKREAPPQPEEPPAPNS